MNNRHYATSLGGDQRINSTFFSVILPTYNRAHLISKAIQSVLSQTYESWELIVVDDGSTDNTEDVVKSFRDARIRYIYQRNQERSAARNNGIIHSTGRYICFLDSDDYYLKDRLVRLFESIKAYGFPRCLFYTNKLIEIDGRKQELPGKLVRCDNVYDQIILSTIHAQQVCVHHSVFAEHQFNPNFRVAEDTELWLRIADKFNVVPIEESTVVVVKDDKRTVNVRTAREMIQTVRFFLRSAHSGRKISTTVQKNLLSSCYFSLSREYLMNRKFIKGFLYLVISILADWSHAQTKYKLNIALKLLSPAHSFNELKSLLSSA